MLGHKGISIASPSSPTGYLAATPQPTGLGGVPVGYEEVALTLPTPGGAITAANSTILGSLGFQVRTANVQDTCGGTTPLCNADYSGYVAVGLSSVDYNGNPCPSPGYTYAWCGAAGTVTFMRKIQTNSRIPTLLSTAQLTAQAVAMGKSGVLNDTKTMTRVCTENGFASVWSYVKGQYSPGGMFSHCGTMPTSYWTGTAWSWLDSCDAVSELTCY